MLSGDLARLYHVEAKALVQAVKRNSERFPGDFMFKLTLGEMRILRSQSVTLRWGGHAKYPPYAFTEQGVAMLSSVLKSRRAIRMNVAIMRAFVKIRRSATLPDEVVACLLKLGRRVDRHDVQLRDIYDSLAALLAGPEPPRKGIGFQP